MDWAGFFRFFLAGRAASAERAGGLVGGMLGGAASSARTSPSATPSALARRLRPRLRLRRAPGGGGGAEGPAYDVAAGGAANRRAITRARAPNHDAVGRRTVPAPLVVVDVRGDLQDAGGRRQAPPTSTES